MRSFTREIGPEIPGSLFAERAPGPLIHNYSQGNNLFQQNKHFRNPHMCWTNINQNMNPHFQSHLCISGRLINYILTVDDKHWVGVGAFLNGRQSWLWPNVEPRPPLLFPPFGPSRINQLWPVKGAHQSLHQAMDLGDCHMLMIVIIVGRRVQNSDLLVGLFYWSQKDVQQI